MQPIFDKNRAINSTYIQMFIIVIAFLIMGVSSFFFVSNIENKHLIKEAEMALAFTESEIVANLLEPETFLGGYSETLRSMLIRGENATTVTAYMDYVTSYFINNKDAMLGLVATHGYFFTWGGKYINAREDWATPEDFSPENQIWYQKAIDAKGKISISSPYRDLITENYILTFSRYITDDNGKPLAILCLDIDLNRIYKYAVSINLTESSYGILISNEMVVIAHPAKYFVGEKLYNVDSGIAFLADELEVGRNIKERRIKNYMYEDAIVYFMKIKYDWFLGIVIPVNEYYKSANHMAAFLILIGSLLAWALCTMLYFLAQAKAKSDIRNQQKSNFLATMSHEIRTPLNAILGITEIQMQNTDHPQSTSEAFLKINNSGNLLLNIINDILDLSKIESGKLELIPIKYEVARLINDIIQLNYIRYVNKPIEFIIEIDENIPSYLIGDDLRIKQILNNLLSNAFKYTNKGEVTLSIGVEYVGRGGAVLVSLVFQISDTGQGMSGEQIKKLFDEYTRFNMEANRTTEGAGLGMTITRNLVDLMYGKITVKSALGEGTTFTVKLPQKTDGKGISGVIGKETAEKLSQFKQNNSVQANKTRIIHEYMPYGSILIVDDVETNLYVAKGLMLPYGIKIDLAESGFEAIQKIKDGEDYDIVFMDHMMPKMDGIEATKQLRKMNYTKPIVALTANALTGQAEMFLNNGFDDFISKPIDIHQLNRTLNKFIRDKQTPETIKAAQEEKIEMDKKRNPVQGFQQIDSQLAKIFAKDAEKAVNVIKKSLHKNLNNEKDVQMYIINVHAMKSALANIGEKELSSTANKLEQACRDKNKNMILSETGEFLEKLEKVIKEIKKRDEKNEFVEDTEESLALLKEKLKVIKDACQVMDKKTVKNILIELREKAWSQKTNKFISAMGDRLLHSEFEEVSALIDEYNK